MKRLCCHVATLLCAILVLVQSAGANTGQRSPFIKGVVVDAKNKAPLVYANIVLRDSETQDFVASTYSGETGEFLLAAVPKGRYILTVSYIGYTKMDVPDISVAEESKLLDLGVVGMAETAVEVGEVTVDAQRAPEEFHLDKKVINVGQSLHAQGGSALDVLREQPSVRVDENENVTLRGSANFTILVNGRPGPFQGSDALRQIPANLIESIELMTNPSAKYEAEGSAGIINIVLKKEENYSTSGIVNIGAGTRDKYNADVTVTRNLGATRITGGADYRKSTTHQVQDVDRLTSTPTGDVTNNSDFRRRDIRDQYTLRMGVDHEFAGGGALSINANLGQVKVPRSFTFDIHNVSPTQDLYQVIRDTRDLTANYFSPTLFYKHSFVPGRRSLTVEGTYTRVKIPFIQKMREYTSNATFTALESEPVSTDQDSDIGRHEVRMNMNYADKVSETASLEAGLQSDYSIRNYDVEYRNYDWINETWVSNDELSNIYSLTNWVHGAFLTWADVLGEFQYQLGLRAEYMDRLLMQKTLVEDFAYDKLDWFPSFSLARKFGEHQLQLSYSRRINRPNENLLNPFPFYSDRYLVSAGNSRLLPEYTHSLELNYQKIFGGVYVSVQTYGRFSANSIWQSMSADSTGRMFSTFGNFAESSNVGAEISASWRPIAWLRLDPNVNLFNYAVDGEALGVNLDQQAFTWTARLSATCTFGPSTRLQATGMYLSRRIGPQTETDPTFYLSVSARQEFLDRRFALTLQAQNLLRSAWVDVTSTGPNFSNSSLIKPEVPIVNLTLTYNFNNYQPTRRPGQGPEVNMGM